MSDHEAKPMGVMGRIVGIFSSPTETFQSIEAKPTWLVPFLIFGIFGIVLQFLMWNIITADALNVAAAKGTPDAQIEMTTKMMQGPGKVLAMIVVPLYHLFRWTLAAALLLFGAKTIMGGEGKFKQVFSVLAWSGLITFVGGLLKVLLVFMKNTTYGVSTSLAAMMPVPPMSEKPGVLYQLLSKLDPFMIWELVLWAISLAVVTKIEPKKSYIVVFSVWVLWIVVSIAWATLFGSRF